MHSFVAVKLWDPLFKINRDTLEVDTRSGQTIDAATEENVSRVEHMTPENRPIHMQSLASVPEIPTKRILCILHAKSNVKNVDCQMDPENVNTAKQTRKGRISAVFGRYAWKAHDYKLPCENVAPIQATRHALQVIHFSREEDLKSDVSKFFEIKGK